jgi:hypothetical protein
MVRFDRLESSDHTQGSVVSSRHGAGFIPAILVSQWPLAARTVRGCAQTESSRKHGGTSDRTLERIGGSSRYHRPRGSLDTSCFDSSDAWERSSKSRRISTSDRNPRCSHGRSYLAAM